MVTRTVVPGAPSSRELTKVRPISGMPSTGHPLLVEASRTETCQQVAVSDYSIFPRGQPGDLTSPLNQRKSSRRGWGGGGCGEKVQNPSLSFWPASHCLSYTRFWKGRAVEEGVWDWARKMKSS